jgi:predicted DNA-binding transcriptional regulator YafY
VARNAELIRQWEILREIDGARAGIGIAKLASLRVVSQRTIRRDIQALCDAGFPLYDEKINGTSMWKLTDKPFKSLGDAGLSVMELCALYFGHSLMTTLAGVPFADDLDRALGKLRRALPPGSRKYLDAMPTLMKAKASGRKKQDDRKMREFASRVADAALTHRRVTMRYASVKSNRTKDYLVEPLRLSYAHGGIYLTAFVPEYNEIRTFALERIQTLGISDDHFDPRPLPPEPFANSLGVHTGHPERIEVEFDEAVASFVQEREWHRSQEFVARADGSVLMKLLVCNDAPLRSWILGFGSHARVVSPASLATEIGEELERGAARYDTVTVSRRRRYAKAELDIFRLKTEPARSVK